MHIHAKAVTLSTCPKCGKSVLSHVVCANCGHYKGKEFIDVMKKLTKKEQKAKQKEMAAKEAEEKKEQEKPLGWEDLSKK